MINFNIGAVENDGTGDKLRDAFSGVNSNFTEMLGYFIPKEDKYNRTEDIANNLTSTIKYPSVKGMVD